MPSQIEQWKTQKTGILILFSQVFRCLLPSEVKKIALVKSSLHKVRFNPHGVRLMGDLGAYSFPDIIHCPLSDTVCWL